MIAVDEPPTWTDNLSIRGCRIEPRLEAARTWANLRGFAKSPSAIIALSDLHPGPRGCVASFMMDQTGSGFLIILAVVFGSYGTHELGRAYRTGPMNEWWDRVLPGAGGLVLAIFLTAAALRPVG